MMIVTSFKKNRNIKDNQKRPISINENSKIAINKTQEDRNLVRKMISEYTDDILEDKIEKQIKTNTHELEDNLNISRKGFRKIKRNKITVRMEKSPEKLLEEDSSNQMRLVILPNIHRHKITRNDNWITY